MQISFEFFPPKTPKGLDNLAQVSETLSCFETEFCSVTFGAAGSTQDTTCATVKRLREPGGCVAPHISCIGMTKDKVDALLEQYKALGVKRLVVLRGDVPSGAVGMAGDFHYASDLVRHIRDRYGDYFTQMVGVYPECHPQADSLQHDLHHFKIKVDQGADAAITQYFFNSDAYYDLLEHCSKLGINIPIIPGIMPINNYTQIARFSKQCGAEIPRYMHKRFIGLGDDHDAVVAYGVEVVSRLCERLKEIGAPGLHFYTLNKSTAISKILENLS